MNALTREALPPGARGRRRDMGELALAGALPRAFGHGRVACRPVDAGAGSRAAPVAG